MITREDLEIMVDDLGTPDGMTKEAVVDMLEGMLDMTGGELHAHGAALNHIFKIAKERGLKGSAPLNSVMSNAEIKAVFERFNCLKDVVPTRAQ